MAGLTTEQLDRFHEDGYLIVEDVLTGEDLEGIEAEYRKIVDRVSADLALEGKLRPLTGTTFSECYIEAMQQLDDMYDLYQHLDISLPLLEDLDHSHTMNTGPEVFRLLTNPRLLDIVESVIGPEIYSNPVQHTRIKPPVRHLPEAALDANIAATLWHQDSAVIDTEADGTDMLTIWLAVTDATLENGCLIVERGSHREEMTLHCPGKVFPAEIYIPESIIDDGRVIPMEVPAGGAILLEQADRARFPGQPQRRNPLELRPPLPTDRTAHRPLRVPRVRRPQPGPPRAGGHRPGRMGEPVVGRPGPHRRRRDAHAPQCQMAGQCPPAHLRLTRPAPGPGLLSRSWCAPPVERDRSRPGG